MDTGNRESGLCETVLGAADSLDGRALYGDNGRSKASSGGFTREETRAFHDVVAKDFQQLQGENGAARRLRSWKSFHWGMQVDIGVGKAHF
ncbi:hypothetical protein Slin15195_G098470 [Septoria linicola]|uniref:Uncharacterized protein n=1 Tax=Septoria linicola TaxID=215465 RepID=A0A9Q9B0A3_9PEZI|nr:hypothetical protein Slin14017_G061530 [Septoria linicola]USW56528.1 hypothetical protein Slin15195_G098470 [Septoria linicola]